jgi:hypothetical protein
MAKVPVFEYSKFSVLETLSPEDKPEVKTVIMNSRKQLEELTGFVMRKVY